MSGRVLVDTNVLVYAYDRSEPGKQAQAVEVLDQLFASASGVLSSQVLGELFVALTRRIAVPLGVDEAYDRVAYYAGAWPVLPVTSPISLEAARGVRDHRLSYWDAQLWATARLNQVPIILTEDFCSGATVDGVRLVSPFAAGFDWFDLGLD